MISEFSERGAKGSGLGWLGTVVDGKDWRLGRALYVACLSQSIPLVTHLTWTKIVRYMLSIHMRRPMSIHRLPTGRAVGRVLKGHSWASNAHGAPMGHKKAG